MATADGGARGFRPYHFSGLLGSVKSRGNLIALPKPLTSVFTARQAATLLPKPIEQAHQSHP